MQFSPATKLTAIIGDPVTHSLSPFLHNRIFADEGVDAAMLAFGNPEVEPLVASVRALPIHLAAVTMPHKQRIMPLLDGIDEEAEKIGAVNTVVNRAGVLTGHNTDIIGITYALRDVPLKGAKTLLIGAGGAARPAAHLLVREGAELFIKNHDRAQAEEVIERFGGRYIEDEELGAHSFDLILNATPVGMKPNVNAMPLNPRHIKKGAAVFDFVYSPIETALLATAEERGARAVSGLTMFLEQGVEQERLWLGRDIDAAKYSRALEEHVRGER